MIKAKKLLASIIIINFNGERFLGKCLNSITQNTKVTFEVILVDNGSKDKSLEILEKKFNHKKWLKIIALPKNIGPASARNIGVKNSKGEYLVFLDYDTQVDKNWLGQAITYLTKQPKIGAGQLKILKMDTKRYDCAGERLTELGFLSERARGAKDAGQFDQIEDIFSGKTAAMIVKRKVFEKVNGFDEDLFMYWEEPDFCWRIWKKGYRVVFLPMGKIWHAYGTKNKKVSQQHSIWITQQGCRNQLITILKNATGLNLIKMFLAAMTSWLFLLIFFTIKLDLPKTKAILKALFWMIGHPRMLIKKRRELKKQLGQRFYQDNKWLPQVIIKRNFQWYFGKGLSYLLNKEF